MVRFSVSPRRHGLALLLAALALAVPTAGCGTSSQNTATTASAKSPTPAAGGDDMSGMATLMETARLLANEPEYGAWAWEIHHATKKDAPSGTLLKLVDDMKGAGYSRPIDVGSNRAGMHPGTHEIGFDSAADTITLRHVARGREGFARGALKAAQWVVGKKGFHEFREILFS